MHLIIWWPQCEGVLVTFLPVVHVKKSYPPPTQPHGLLGFSIITLRLQHPHLSATHPQCQPTATVDHHATLMSWTLRKCIVGNGCARWLDPAKASSDPRVPCCSWWTPSPSPCRSTSSPRHPWSSAISMSSPPSISPPRTSWDPWWPRSISTSFRRVAVLDLNCWEPCRGWCCRRHSRGNWPWQQWSSIFGCRRR